MFFMKKEIILTAVITLVVAGLLGFYSGRIFERKTQRQRFEAIRGTMQQRQSSGQPGGGMRRFDQQPSVMPSVPSPLQSK
jgi:hypothetical protein